MTPGARAQTAIELLDGLPKSGPADQHLSRYFRRHRFVGAKDRRAIAQLVYDVLRRRAQLDWWIADAGAGAGNVHNRMRVLAALALIEHWPADAIAAAFDGGQYRPTPLADDERRIVERITPGEPELVAAGQPGWVRNNYPEWLEAALQVSLGDGLDRELGALLNPAPVDLRVNRLKGTREAARRLLADEGVESEPTPLCPDGLRLAARRTLPSLKAFSQGFVEVQDEGSQLAALLVDAKPGQAVADYCAGGGGKTLAMAATMRNEGSILASDTDEARLRSLGPRLRRAGVTIAEGTLLDDDGAGEGLEPGAFDRVLLDVPCSGTGAWRRSPDAKWRLSEQELLDEVERQRAILTAAAELPKIGVGRLVYVTCSILQEENENQIEWFLAQRSDYAVLPIDEVWAATVGGVAPVPGPALRLSPAGTATDGFFVAVMERRA